MYYISIAAFAINLDNNALYLIAFWRQIRDATIENYKSMMRIKVLVVYRR